MSTGRHDWSDPPEVPGAKFIVQMRLFRLADHMSEELVEVSVPIFAENDLEAFWKSGDALADHLRQAWERSRG